MNQPKLTRTGFEVASGLTFFVKGEVSNIIKRQFISSPIYLGEDPKSFRQSFLGTPIVSDITFGYPDGDNSYIDLNGKKIPYTAVTLDLVLLTVSSSKIITKTQIQGRNSTIKEYISDGDNQIELKCILSDKNNNYPQRLIQDVINICKIPSEIPIFSNYLSMWGINYVVIESFNFPQNEGFRNQQEFTISMISDESITLDSIDKQQHGQSVLTSDKTM